MTNPRDNQRSELEAKLRSVEERFAREMRERGFELDQAENVALPTSLARLYAEREALRAELEETMSVPPAVAGGWEEATMEGGTVMKETERIREQLQRAFAGGAWHGPSVLELLENVTASQAAARPIAGAHNIWELVLHIKAWEGACRRRLLGDRAELPDEENWPPVAETSAEAWDKTLAALREGHQKLSEAIAAVDEARLDEPILQGMGTVYTTLHGAVQHDLYHAGQIAILKKAATGEPV